MPLIVDGAHVPTRWLERKLSGQVVEGESCGARTEFVRIALINNMPDAALEDTELQFFELLDAASGNLPVFLNLYSLDGVPRGERGMRHLNTFYQEISDLWDDRLDGVIVTGTEPHHADLKDEPYWRILSNVLDWAATNTTSTILSCLAAHASALHSDGISRQRLPDKQFGVFRSDQVCEHVIVENLGRSLCFPHSRWNELRESDLVTNGYTILTKSSEAGVDIFVKQKARSLFLYFQGHPEYGAETLLKEYRRDVRRFLTGERDAYPGMPHGYFDISASRALAEFQEIALRHRTEQLMERFPQALITDTLSSQWHSPAMSVYGNWLRHVLSKKVETPVFFPVNDLGNKRQGRRSVVS